MSTIEIPRFHFGCLEFDHVTRTVRMFNPKQTIFTLPRAIKDFIAQIRYFSLNFAGLKDGKD